MPSGYFTRTKEMKKRGSENPNWKGGVSFCVDCNKKLTYRYSWKKEPRCRDCWKKSIAGNGHPRWLGTNIKTSDGKYRRPCIICNGETGSHNSLMCHNCHKGALHHCWKGGISSLVARIRSLPENRQWQKQVMYRDNWKCTECGLIPRVAQTLEVHHIKSFALIVKENEIKTIEQALECKELWDIENGKTLCRECHKLTENYATKLK